MACITCHVLDWGNNMMMQLPFVHSMEMALLYSHHCRKLSTVTFTCVIHPKKNLKFKVGKIILSINIKMQQDTVIVEHYKYNHLISPPSKQGYVVL